MPGKQITLLDDEQWPGEAFGVSLPIDPDTTALGVIDVQHYALDSKSDAAGVVQTHNPELQRDFVQRAGAMVANIETLLTAFRARSNRVFYTRHGQQLRDGSDLIARRRGREQIAHDSTGGTAGHMALKGEPAYDVVADIAPRDGELVLDKNTSSAFHSTAIELFLRNMGIETMVLTGVAADMCVFATALDAADRGFHVIIAADACETFDKGSAEAVQILFGRVWGYVMNTADIVTWLTSGHAPEQTRLQVRCS